MTSALKSKTLKEKFLFKFFILYFSWWRQMLSNERRKFVITFQDRKQAKGSGNPLLNKSFWCLMRLLAWTTCGTLDILGGDYSRRRSPHTPIELATYPLKTQKTLANELLVQKETWHIETKLSLSFNREWTSYNKCTKYTKPRGDLR